MKVGIIGAGQLGRMLALAGFPLGLRFQFVDRSTDASAAQVAPILVGELTDSALLTKLARGVDVVTFDWENVSAEGLAAIEAQTTVLPPAAALAASQDRLFEKQLFRRAAHTDSAVRRRGFRGRSRTCRTGDRTARRAQDAPPRL